MTYDTPQFDHPVRNQLSCDALEWYDEKTLERDLTRDEFHMFILGVIDATAHVACAQVGTLQYEVDAIPAIKEERDALALGVDQWRVDFHELRLERDALAAAAKLALDAAVDAYATCDWPFGDDGQKAMESLSKAIEALRQAGVQ